LTQQNNDRNRSNNPNDRNRSNNPNDRNRAGTTEDGTELQEHVVAIRRVAKVVKGGRHLTFNAMVVVGDGKGHVGAGLGKGSAVPDAVRKGTTIAKKNMITVPMVGSTVPHRVNAHFGASDVIIKPGQPGSGVKAGGAVRAVMEAAGVRDVVTKALGSRNPINVVKATLEGLSSMQRADGEDPDGKARGAALPPVSPDRRGPLRREGGGGFRGRDRDRDRRPPPRSSAPSGAPAGVAPTSAATPVPAGEVTGAPTEAPAPAPQASTDV
jgi:small subunit ribosomal protein S5